jgi:hypothetical protein
LYSDTTVPKFIDIASNNASVQYPNLPKSIQNIIIKIINETGVLNDTYINLDKLSFRIDQDILIKQILEILLKKCVDAVLKEQSI